MGTRIKKHQLTLTLLVSLIILSCASIFIGAIDITGIFQGDFSKLELVFISRVPRLLAVILTGVGMSVSGLIMQQLCANKFVSPTTGATISAAQFGVMLSLVFFSGATLFQKTMLAFVTSILGTWAFVWLIQRIKFKDVIMVPLIGIMFGSIIGALTNFFAYRYDIIQSLQTTLVGDFSLIIRGRYEIVYLVVPLVIIAFIYANHFNIVGMGENFSKNLGVNHNVVLFSGLSIAALITASIVVTVGTVSYVGLIIPNIMSMFRGDKIQKSLIDVALLGSVYVLACDIIGRIAIFPYELPIDLISGIIGSILFITLMFKRLSQGKPKKRGGLKHA